MNIIHNYVHVTCKWLHHVFFFFYNFLIVYRRPFVKHLEHNHKQLHQHGFIFFPLTVIMFLFWFFSNTWQLKNSNTSACACIKLKDFKTSTKWIITQRRCLLLWVLFLWVLFVTKPLSIVHASIKSSKTHMNLNLIIKVGVQCHRKWRHFRFEVLTILATSAHEIRSIRFSLQLTRCL